MFKNICLSRKCKFEKLSRMQQQKHGQRVLNAPVQVEPRQPTASHTASSTPETGKQFLAAPMPKLGKCPVRRGGLSFHCHS